MSGRSGLLPGSRHCPAQGYRNHSLEQCLLSNRRGGSQTSPPPSPRASSDRPGDGWSTENGILIASYTEDQSPEFSSFREEWRHYHPKTEEVVPEDGIDAEAERTAHVEGTVDERATTQHTIAARRNAKSGVREWSNPRIPQPKHPIVPDGWAVPLRCIQATLLFVNYPRLGET